MKSIASGLSVLAVCGAVLTTLAPFAQAQPPKPKASPTPVVKTMKPAPKTMKPAAKKPMGKMAHKGMKPMGKMAPKPAATPTPKAK